MDLELAHRFIFTESCNKKCPHCFNSDVRKKKHLDKDEFLNWLRTNQRYIGRTELKVMGGEPTIHPDFFEMTEQATEYYGNITLFTNGSTMDTIQENVKLMRHHYFNRLHFILNGYTAEKEFDYSMFNQVAFHIVIPNEDEAYREMLSKAIALTRIPNHHIVISGDTGVNLFDDKIMSEYRERYYTFWKEIIHFLSPRFSYSVDHPFPVCFFTKKLIRKLQDLGIGPINNMFRSCCWGPIGLIDTEWGLWYCNQTRIKIADNIQGLSIPEIHKWIQGMPEKKIDLVSKLNEKCRECPALSHCKTNCWCKTLQNKC